MGGDRLADLKRPLWCPVLLKGGAIEHVIQYTSQSGDRTADIYETVDGKYRTIYREDDRYRYQDKHDKLGAAKRDARGWTNPLSEGQA